MKNDKEDRRIQKTKQAIQEALFLLMQKKQYKAITIQNIIDKANVGRSTFYSHYQTKDELLFESISPMMKMLNGCIIKYIESGGLYSEIATVSALFEHIKQNSGVFKKLIKADNSDLFFNGAALRGSNQMQKYLSAKMKLGHIPKIPLPMLTHHISTTLVELVKWWLKNNMPYSPAQMNHYFHELISPCLNSN